MAEKFPDENTRHLINMGLRAAVTVIVAVAAWQFKEMNDDLKRLEANIHEGRVVSAVNFTQKDWAIQREALDRRFIEQGKQLIELQGKVNALEKK